MIVWTPDWLYLYWVMTLCTGLFLLSLMLRNYRMLGSYRMILEMLDLASDSKGEDRKWSVRPDEESAKKFILLVIIGASLFWPITLVTLIAVSGDENR